MIDIHTHNPEPDADRILCLDPTDGPVDVACLQRPFSAGIHPWHAHIATDEAFAELGRLATSPACVAIGEAGFDRNAQASVDEQEKVLLPQILLAKELHKPLILHLVGQSARLIDLHKAYAPDEPWIVHGFRGKPELARQLLAEGFYLSFGAKFNPETLATVPDDRLLLETDDSVFIPEQIAALYAPERVKVANINAIRLFGLPIIL